MKIFKIRKTLKTLTIILLTYQTLKHMSLYLNLPEALIAYGDENEIKENSLTLSEPTSLDKIKAFIWEYKGTIIVSSIIIGSIAFYMLNPEYCHSVFYEFWYGAIENSWDGNLKAVVTELIKFMDSNNVRSLAGASAFQMQKIIIFNMAIDDLMNQAPNEEAKQEILLYLGKLAEELSTIPNMKALVLIICKTKLF